ncbi:hypothetical protein [Chryseobacterium indoltheticum]|uniref:hypothetical protein n=1 Tax=Chryseobacterium indoltheticum TaxID=254 RepID=UPI003F4994DF
MKNKIIVLLTIIYLSITSCQSFKVKNDNNDNSSFAKQFFSNPAVIYNLKKYAVGNQINILDSKKVITENPIVFKNDDLLQQ